MGIVSHDLARHRPHAVSRDVSRAARRQPGRQGAGRRACGRWRRATSAASATDQHRSVDDTPAGGGPGMVLRADVLAAAIDAADAGDDRPRLLMSPRGRPLTQARVAELAAGPGPLIVCGRFEGVDERVIEAAEPRGGLDRRLRAVRRRDRRDGADRRLRAAAAGRDGQAGLGRGRELFRGTTGIPAIHPPAGVRGPRRSRRS